MELRKAIAGEEIDKEKVYALIEQYGQLDGKISALYAERFSQVNATLTEQQRAQLIEIRNLDVVPEGAYAFSTPIAMPEVPNTDYMFAVTSIPDDAGNSQAPQDFNSSVPEIGGQ